MQRDLQECRQQDFQGQQPYQAPNYQSIIPETSDAVIYTNYMNKNIIGAIKPTKKYSNESLLTPKGLYYVDRHFFGQILKRISNISLRKRSLQSGTCYL